MGVVLAWVYVYKKKMHVETDLIKSDALSKLSGCSVWLKMENQQISGSFKYRGISLLCKKAVDSGCSKLVCSSGGNAGLAAAFAARELKIPISVYVPETTYELTKDKLRQQGASVIEHGKIWDEANEKALMAAQEPGVQFIHPFDNSILWEGHSSIILEAKNQLDGITPDLVVTAVGGGGLLNGILQGLYTTGWTSVPVLAMETIGANSLNACVQANEWVELPTITSIAKCLGARKICRRSYEWLSQHTIFSEAVPDEEAIKACVRFLDDHNIIVPPACGAALSAVYCGIVSRLLLEDKLQKPFHNVLIVVCGGSGIDKEKIEEWRNTYM